MKSCLGGVINVVLVIHIVHRKHLVQKDEETISSMINVEEGHFIDEDSILYIAYISS